MGVDTSRSVRGAAVGLMGDGAAATAGLTGTECVVAGGILRAVFVCGSALPGIVVDGGSLSTGLVAGMSSLPGCWRLAVAFAA